MLDSPAERVSRGIEAVRPERNSNMGSGEESLMVTVMIECANKTARKEMTTNLNQCRHATFDRCRAVGYALFQSECIWGKGNFDRRGSIHPVHVQR